MTSIQASPRAGVKRYAGAMVRGLLVLVWLSACTTAGGGTTQGQPVRPQASPVAAGQAPEQPAAPAANQAAVPAPALELRLQQGPDGLQPVLINRHSAPVSLKRGLSLQRHSAQGWSPVPQLTPLLRHDCETPAADCLTLVPGAELQPPAIVGSGGSGGSGQCDCSECQPLAPGEYRLVVAGCGDGFRVPGTPLQHP